MFKFRVQWTLGAMLTATAVAAGGWYLLLPTLRAEQFAGLIRAGDYQAAEAMVPSAFVESRRPYFSSGFQVVIEPVALEDIWHGQRQVHVRDRSTGEAAIFYLKRTSASSDSLFFFVEPPLIISTPFGGPPVFTTEGP